jgi:hypothetical protein
MPSIRRPTVSVVCPTGHPGPLVAELLGVVRDAVDEIVVAADARASASDLGHYAQVADVLLRYEHAGANRHWPWLARQAHGDWLLLLDGDELASAALVAALPDLVADRRVQQYSLPIHWLWPDARSRLTGEPWASDRRLRLVRNDGRLQFGARKHILAEPDTPIGYLDELPVLHLDLLLGTRDAREAKVARYDAELFGLLTPEGLPFNEAFYLPEAGGRGDATAAVPELDAEAAERALGARADPARTRDPATVALHDRAEIAWHAPRSTLPEGAYRASVRLARPLGPFTAGRADHAVWVRVTNEGEALWPGGVREPLVRLGVGWQPVGGGPREEVGRAALPHALGPGESALVPVEVRAPDRAGPAELVLDLVHEHVRWFDRPLTTEVQIGPSVATRLAALAERHGDLVPPAALLRERAAVGARDALVPPTPMEAPPADPALAELIAGLPLGGWALDGPTIDRLAALVRERRPRAVLELGSGTSTVVLAALLGDAATLVTFEQDPGWAQHTRDALRERGLQAHVLDVGVGDVGAGAPPGYVLTDEAGELLRAHPPEIVLVDGPTMESGASRLGAVELVAPFAAGDVTLLLDDALRDAELRIAEAWGRRDDVTVAGIRLTPKGLLEATLHARPAPRGRLRRLIGRAR